MHGCNCAWAHTAQPFLKYLNNVNDCIQQEKTSRMPPIGEYSNNTNHSIHYKHPSDGYRHSSDGEYEDSDDACSPVCSLCTTRH